MFLFSCIILRINRRGKGSLDEEFHLNTLKETIMNPFECSVNRWNNGKAKLSWITSRRDPDGGNDCRRKTRRVNTVRLWQVKRRGHTMVGVSSVIVGHEVAALVFLQV